MCAFDLSVYETSCDLLVNLELSAVAAYPAVQCVRGCYSRRNN